MLKLPDEVITELLELRVSPVAFAFRTGQVVADIIEKARENGSLERGMVGQVVRTVAGYVDLSPSRVRRFLDLWTYFGDHENAIVRYTDYPVLGLAKWEMAYRIRNKPDLLQAFLEICTDAITVSAQEALELAKARVQEEDDTLDEAVGQEDAVGAGNGNGVMGLLVRAVRDGRIPPKAFEMWLEEATKDEAQRFAELLARRMAEDVEVLASVMGPFGASEETRALLQAAWEKLGAVLDENPIWEGEL